ncbi:MAG: hypothetical protein NTZ46_01205 [Verrucomicrobia bacterium]|nr:hypothetical protein [Verrucomicrobiota bacterium]
MSSTCILVPSYPGNEEASLFTLRLLTQHWAQHPPLYRIGMAPVLEGDLPFAGDTRSWIEVLQSGCVQLLEKGFDSVYLILDDHPPVGACHEAHLNVTLPTAMAALGGCYFQLTGWDGMTYFKSQAVCSNVRGLRRLGPGFQFHFQLHPALWNLKMLEGLSRRFLELGFRTAWDFERAARSLYPELPKEWQQGGYAIQGRGMQNPTAVAVASATPLRAWIWRRLDRWSRRAKPVNYFSARFAMGFFLRRYLGVSRRAFQKMDRLQRMRAFAGRCFDLPPAMTAEMSGGDFRKHFRRWMGFDRCVYEGPYPIYRNGFLIRGALNRLFLEYLRATGQQETAQELMARYPLAPPQSFD